MFYNIITEHLKTTIPFHLPIGSFNTIDNKGSNLRFGTYLEGADVNRTHVSIWEILVVQQPAEKKRVVIYVHIYHGFIFVFMNWNVVRLGNRAC